MKRLWTICMAALMMLTISLSASAQNSKKVEKFGIFNHLSVGASAGLDGIGIDVASCLTDYVQVRAGASFFPKITYNQEFSPNVIPAFKSTVKDLKDNYGYTVVEEPLDIQAKLGFNTGKILFDIFPFPKKTSFHVTVGLYMGSSDIVTIRNVDEHAFDNYRHPNYGPDPNLYNKPLYGIRLGNYNLRPNDEGILEAGLNVNAVRPYLGLGFGRAVPKKRIGFMFELGVQFWGSPRLYFDGGEGRHYVTKEDFTDNGSNDGGLIKTLNEITVYPMMTFRLTGRIF